jgi:hypothetical protein
MKITLQTIKELIKETLDEQGMRRPGSPGLGPPVAPADGGKSWRKIGSVDPRGTGITGSEQFDDPKGYGSWDQEGIMTVARALCEKGLNLGNADALQRTAGGLGVTLEDFLTHVQGSTIDSNLTTGAGGPALRLLNRAKRKGWVTDLPPGTDCSVL